MNKIARVTSALICASIATAAAASPPAAGVCGAMTPTDGWQLPSTAAVARLAMDWADKINSADDAAYIRFMEERGPVQPGGPDRWLESRNVLRGVQLCGVKSAKAILVALAPGVQAGCPRLKLLPCPESSSSGQHLTKVRLGLQWVDPA